MGDESSACPSCGGSGGGPFGRAGSAWDVETYVCPRCQGLGVVPQSMPVARPLAKGRADLADASAPGPGIADCGDPILGKTSVARK